MIDHPSPNNPSSLCAACKRPSLPAHPSKRSNLHTKKGSILAREIPHPSVLSPPSLSLQQQRSPSKNEGVSDLDQLVVEPVTFATVRRGEGEEVLVARERVEWSSEVVVQMGKEDVLFLCDRSGMEGQVSGSDICRKAKGSKVGSQRTLLASTSHTHTTPPLTVRVGSQLDVQLGACP